MSERAINWFANLPAEVLSHAEFRLLNKLVWLHNELENCAWPSYDFLSEKTGLSRGGIAKCMASLELKNIIQRERIDGKTTRYFMCFEFEGTSQLSEQSDAELVNSVNGTSQLSRPELVNSVDYIKEQDNRTIEKNIPPIVPQTHSKHDLELEFEKVWANYPRKVGKGKAEKKWLQVRHKHSREEICQPLGKFIQAVRNTDPQFIPHLATWLNQERWRDEPAHATNARQSSDQQMDNLLNTFQASQQPKINSQSNFPELEAPHEI